MNTLSYKLQCQTDQLTTLLRHFPCQAQKGNSILVYSSVRDGEFCACSELNGKSLAFHRLGVWGLWLSLSVYASGCTGGLGVGMWLKVGSLHFFVLLNSRVSWMKGE